MLGDRRSAVMHPDPFKGSYVLNSALPSDDSWATLAVIPLEHVLPPRGVTARYEFKCLAYASAGRDYVGPPSPVGHVLVGVEYATFLSLPGPGYVDELDWLVLSERLLGFIEGIVRGCVEELPEKRSKVRSFVESLTPPVTSPARAAMLKVAIERAYISSKPGSVLDYDIVEAVRVSKDAVLIEGLARLTFHLASHEPTTSEARKVFAVMRSCYDVNVNGYHICDVDPLPPVVAPLPVSVPSVPNFELRIEPVEEAGRVKAVEVQVRGTLATSNSAKPVLDFWLWDETAGDEPFIVSSADIDQVYERAVHEHPWQSDEHDPHKWQTAGVVRFNRIMPPVGGGRRISVAGRIQSKSFLGYLNLKQTVRSKPVVMNIAVPGYQAIRNARQGLRFRAFSLVVGLALLSGKGPTYRQEKALKKFAEQLCARIADRKIAEANKNDLFTLIDSNVESGRDSLTRELDQLVPKSYPELKSQLLEAFEEVMASRKIRSKESRDFLQYSRGLLA
jgi:hypothetical protein